jgi:hypothetical protein
MSFSLLQFTMSIIVYSIFFYSIVSFYAQFSWMIYQKLLIRDKIKTNEIDEY